MPSNNPPLLSPLDAANLKAQGLLAPGTTPSSQHIHKRRVHSSSDAEYQSIPLSASVSSSSFFTIPTVLVCRQTFRYVGLSDSKSDDLWNLWTHEQALRSLPRWWQWVYLLLSRLAWLTRPWQRENLDTEAELRDKFLAFILAHTVECAGDATTEEDKDWLRCMDECGVDKGVQDDIMDPEFTYLRLSDSCLYWVRDTVEMRYRGLGAIQRSSQMREEELLGRDGRGGRGAERL